MKCLFCSVEIAFYGQPHGCPWPELYDPAGPEDFRGSDEGSHLMATKQGLGGLLKPPPTPPPRTHELKTWPGQFNAVLEGRKTFELRRNDRDFRVGDRLVLREWVPETQRYTDRALRFHVTYVTEGNVFGSLVDGFVCLGIALEGE